MPVGRRLGAWITLLCIDLALPCPALLPAALSVKALLYPESLLDDGPAPPPRSTGPDVSVTDDIFAVRRAFAAAEREAKKQQQGDKSNGSSSSGSSR